MSKEFVNKGHEVTLITRGNDNQEFEIIDGVKILRTKFLPIYPFHVHLHRHFMEKIINSFKIKYDIIHMHSPLVLPILYDNPLVSTMHTTLKGSSSETELVDPRALFIKIHSWTISNIIEKEVINKSKLIMTTCNKIKIEIKRYGIKNDDIYIVYNGVDINKYKPKNNSIDDRYVLFVGRLVYRKGLFDLMKAASIIRKKDIDIKFIVVGKGPLLSLLMKCVKDMKLEKNVKFTGYIDEKKLIELYQNATMNIIPSHYEGTTGTLLQAMACGNATIATNVGGHSEVIMNGVNGLLIPSKDPVKIAEAINKLVSDDTLSKKLGLAARKTIKNGFTWNHLAKRVEKCYLKALESNA